MAWSRAHLQPGDNACCCRAPAASRSSACRSRRPRARNRMITSSSDAKLERARGGRGRHDQLQGDARVGQGRDRRDRRRRHTRCSRSAAPAPAAVARRHRARRPHRADWWAQRLRRRHSSRQFVGRNAGVTGIFVGSRADFEALNAFPREACDQTGDRPRVPVRGKPRRPTPGWTPATISARS